MAHLATSNPTILDLAKAQNPDGSIATIAEVLHQKNEILHDMPWMAGNMTAGHRTTVRTGLPTPAWRLLNEGVQPSKGTTAQIDEACAKMESWSEVDEALAEFNGNVAAYRWTQAKAHLEAMNQEFASTLFYGNGRTSPAEFTGLSARFSSLSAENGRNIIDGGAAGVSGGDYTSIWLIGWGENSISGIYPKGTVAGLQHKDLGCETKEMSAGIGGTLLRVYRDQFIWNCGIAMMDWRYIVRIANIDVSQLVSKTAAADLTELMAKATHKMESLSGVKCAFYANRSVRMALDIQRRDDVILGGGLSYQDVDGKLIPHFRGIPFRLCDQLLETESLVS